MSTTNHYFKVIRKIHSSFASLFSNIILIRENAVGVEDQRLLVPIEYGDAEKYVKRLRGDPELNKKIQVTLPRMSYQLVGMYYDESRKLNTNNKNFAIDPTSSSSVLSQYNPVPYDFNFLLSIYVRNIEDGNQIIEQILPYFTKDYTLRLNLVPDMGIIKNVPVILNQIEQTIDSEGDYSSSVRTVIWTLKFTVKAFIFGAIKDAKLIANTNINISSNPNGYPPNSLYSIGFGNKFDAEGVCCAGNVSKYYNMLPNGFGDYERNEIVYQGQSLDYAYATGKVYEWNANTDVLTIQQICGDFKLNQPIVGMESYAIHIPSSLAANNYIALDIHVSPDPLTANANSYYTANVTYTEI